MRWQFGVLSVLLAVSMLCTAAWGHRDRGRSSSIGGPAVGERLPDVTAYDADGKEINLRSLRGQHTVLVFGCLT